MTEAKKTEAPERETALDRITAQLRTMLRYETADIIRIGDLLIEAHKHLGHGEWMPWLAKNFDMSYSTAANYMKAAEYVERQKQICNVANLDSLSPTVLYRLAAGDIYNEQEEVAILAATTCEGRVDTPRAGAICAALLVPPTPDDDDHNQEDDEDGGDDTEATAAEDPEITAILDGPSPAVPETASPPPPTDFALRDFDKAISTLKRLMTKSTTQFVQTSYSANDLESAKSFIDAVMKAKVLVSLSMSDTS
jgi:hypothetical protein